MHCTSGQKSNQHLAKGAIFHTLRRRIMVHQGANNEYTGGPAGPGTGFCGPGGGFFCLSSSGGLPPV